MNIQELTKAAMLHDIGKILYRSDPSLGNHSTCGATFLENYLDDNEYKQEFLNCVKYHHGKLLNRAKLPPSAWAYIVYEADNIASAMDRRDVEGEDVGFDPHLPLSSIFSAFGNTVKEDARYYLRGLDSDKVYNYPTTDDISASIDKYKEIVTVLKDNFSSSLLSAMTANELLRIYEDTTVFIPASTNKSELCDISLFMHSKITAALAACMVTYFSNEGIVDHRKHCVQDKDLWRNEEAFTILSGDLSGIQNFIYNAPSKGALKSLRGRSFYLEILMEHVVDEILERLSLSRAQILFMGGGHFYLLLPNSEGNIKAVEHVIDNANRWLLAVTKGLLFLAHGHVPCSANQLMNKLPNGDTGLSVQRKIFSDANTLVSRNKTQRYIGDTLAQLFNTHSQYNAHIEGSRECTVCHTSSIKLTNYRNEQRDICPLCKGLLDMGETIISSDSICFVVVAEENPCDGYAKVPLLHENTYLYVVPENKLDEFSESYLACGLIKRIYVKNKALTGSLVSERLWLADHVTKDEQRKTMDFSTIAEQSGNDKEGVPKLGVLRADVDNLGAAFLGGFLKDTDNPAQYSTFTRYAELSRRLSQFFKLAVNKIAKGELPTGIVPFTFHQKVGGTKRYIHIVYSGGDDVFMVGAWDDLIGLAVDMYRALQVETSGKITMSAGFALFPSSYPVKRMADITGKLEDVAKQQTNKNSIALFTLDEDQPTVHNWNSFINGVCREKLEYLLQTVYGDDSFPIQATALYRLRLLIKEVDESIDGKMNLARILYMLARLQPMGNDKALLAKYTTFINTMQQWIRNEQHRRELITALDLMIYSTRNK